MTTRKQGRKIAIAGGSGTIGGPTLAALLEAGIHTITVLSRASSDVSFPSGVQVKKGNYTDQSFLVSALGGHDFLILAIGRLGRDVQIPLIKAAAEAGVRWLVPSEFGPDPYAPLVKESPIIASKKKYRDLAEELGLSWISVVCNPYLDWSLENGSWSIDIKGREAKLVDGGISKFNTTTIKQTAKGVATLLSLPDTELSRYKNKPVFLSSAYISMRELLSSVIRATGTSESDWDIKRVSYDDDIKIAREEAAKGSITAMIEEFYDMNTREGFGGDYQSKAIKDMESLGLEEEDLDRIVKQVVQKV
ncbi:hypothetical protein F5884DRAFT_727138 [Xylogone sp. PMI_703]|nr:hypothetical protein F5884DRAFT_727138 [Xylogone sp. PMI_703]